MQAAKLFIPRFPAAQEKLFTCTLGLLYFFKDDNNAAWLSFYITILPAGCVSSILETSCWWFHCWIMKNWPVQVVTEWAPEKDLGLQLHFVNNIILREVFHTFTLIWKRMVECSRWPWTQPAGLASFYAKTAGANGTPQFRHFPWDITILTY